MLRKTARNLCGSLMPPHIGCMIWKSLHSINPKSQFKSYLDSVYTDEETVNILKYFNNGSEDQLLSVKHLTRTKVRNIIQHRALTDGFNHISSILNVPGIGFLGLKKVCEALKDSDYQEETTDDSPIEKSRMQCHPPITVEQCKEIRSLMSLEIQQDKVHWAVMSSDLILLDWGQTVIFSKPFQKYDHVDFIEKFNEAVNNLPKADVYTMEEKMYRYPSLRIVPYVVSMKVTEAMFAAILNRDFNTTRRHSLYTIKPNVVSKCFDLSIGGERISGQHIVRDIIQNSREDHTDANSLYIPSHLAKYFQYERNEDRELLSNCLLQALAIYKLIIFPRSRNSNS